MSNRKKLPKQKETTDYTIADMVEETVEHFGAHAQKVIDEANEKGEHGVMVIMSEFKVFECDLVPYGKVFHAGSSRAVDNMRITLAQEN